MPSPPVFETSDTLVRSGPPIRSAKCVVVGGAGFIGQALVSQLVAEGHEVTVIDVRKPELPCAGVDYQIGSYADNNLTSRLLKGKDICLHLASTTTPASSDANIGYDLHSNVCATIALLDVCVSANLRRFVFLSSGGTVYGPPDKTPTPEDHLLRPICAYGVAKVAIENYLRVYKVTRDLDFKIIRLSNPYGPLQSTTTGQGVIPVFIRRAINRELIQIWGDGSVVRDFIYIDDVARGICAVSFSDTIRDVYNIGSGVGMSLNQLLSFIEKIHGYPPIVEYLASRSFDVPANILDCSAVHQDLGWRQQVDLESGLRLTLNHWLNLV